MTGLVEAVRAQVGGALEGRSAEVELALMLAAWMEDPETSDTAKASMAGRLSSLLAELRTAAPAEVSPLDRIRDERDAGVARLADAADHARSRRR